MALIGTIRNNFWFVLLVLGLALAAFVVMDMVSAGNQGGLGPKQTIGEVAGNKIDYQDFQRTEQALFSGSSDTYAGKTSAWNYLIEKSIIDKQAENLGISVSMDELNELQFGTNLSPVIQNVYRNPQTGQVDRQSLLSIQQAITDGTELNKDFEMKWSQLQSQIIKTAKQDKINALIAKSIYTPNFLAENTGKRTSQMVSFDYIKVPFDYIDDDAVEVTDADIDSYIKENAFKYNNEEETRVVDYTVFNVIASVSDSAAIKTELTSRAATFQSKTTPTEDSIFTVNNEGYFSPFYVSTDDITGDLKDAVSEMAIGDVYGPYLDNGAYFIAKLMDKQIVPDTVEASHILRKATEGNEAEFAAASAFIDSLQNLIETRSAKFSDLATEHSEDPGSAVQGGELDPFTQGKMVPEFNNACFLGSKDGGLYKVRTQFGIHLINVTKRIFDSNDPKYKLAIIRSVIVPSEDTQNSFYEKADAMVSEHRTLKTLTSALEAMAEMSIEKSAPLKRNDYLVGTLGGGESSREIVRWAFEEDTKSGDVSPSIYEYSDPVNYFDNKYVLVGLNKINGVGLSSAEDLRASVEVAVRNQVKANKIAAQITGTDLEALASTYNTSVESTQNTAFTASGVTGLGNEPKVLSAAFTLNEGSVSKPIVGNNGVYVIKTTSKTEGSVPSNVFAQKQTMTSTNRGRVNFSLMNALKEIFKPKDNRSTYF